MKRLKIYKEIFKRPFLVFLLAIFAVLLIQKDIYADAGTLPNKNNRHKVALILTGGAARGLCHIGVINVLEEYGVPIDLLIGISMGSIVGGYYAYGYSVDKMLEIARGFKLSSLIEIDRPFTGFLSGEKLEKIFIRDVDRVNIEDLKKKLLIIATDITDQKMVVFDRGPLYIAMRASSAIPGVFDPVVYNGKVLVDGGVLTKYPIDLAKKFGADIIIVSNVSVSQTMPRSRLVNRLIEVGREYVDRHIDRFMLNKYNRELNLKNILFRTLMLIETSHRIDKSVNLKDIDFMIEPVSDEIKPFDFYKVDEGYELGRKATLKVINGIVKRLKEPR